ncbi:MAG TPA: macro domain-containing protein [Caulobacteraceae bacterium]|jgi:O-acetyl-ADP-ribose deacetylase (regulator of RNase III)|nr:macro domain-containing protein [Caulobacteraceae bacterium]
MKIVLTAMDADLANAWRAHCGDLCNVSIHHGSIFDVACDAMVSPANSLGYMRGGIDALYAKRFAGIEARVRSAIATRFGGEMPVGKALMVETGDATVPWLISAPTMRTPMILGPDTDHPRRAITAALRVAEGMIETIAFPGMGTGVGGVPPDVCARQMREAILSHS